MCLNEMTSIAALAQSILTSLAIIAGGVWAYYRFLSDRIIKPRIEISISGNLFKVGDDSFIEIEFITKNLGLTKIPFDVESSSIILSGVSEEQIYDLVNEISWEEISTFDLLQDHHWIEPSEIIRDKREYCLGKNVPKLIKVDAVLFSKKTQWSGNEIIRGD